MRLCKKIGQWMVLASLCLPLTCFATPIPSIIIFGDSMSDMGNTTHLLKSLRNDEDPSFVVEPFKAFVINKMEDYAEAYSVPQIILDAGLVVVHDFFDNSLAPMLAMLVSKIKEVPVLPGEPYWESRFSNGPVWSEYLATMAGIDTNNPSQFVNGAFAGSWAATYDYKLTVWNLIRHPINSLKNLVLGKLIPPSLGLSVQTYLMHHRTLDKDALYFLFSGGNDYLNALQFGGMDEQEMSDYVDNVINNIEYSLQKLLKAGAKQVIVLGLPHIGELPKFAHGYESHVLNAATDIHNQRLKDRVDVWQADAPDVHFIFVDLEQFLAPARTNPSAYGFTNIDEACIDVKIPLIPAYASSPFAHNYVLNYAQVLQYRGKALGDDEKNYHVCDTPDSYLFWDEVHPNTRAHHFLAAVVCESLRNAGFDAQCTTPELF